MLDYNFLLDKFIDIVYSARLVRKGAIQYWIKNKFVKNDYTYSIKENK